MRLSGVTLTNLDVYRDGGSVSATFREANGNLFELLFKVNLVPPDFDAQGYFEAVLKEYVPTQRTSLITGITDRDFRVDSHAISWEEAGRILDQLENQLEDVDPTYLWVFPEMVRAAAARGGAT